MIALLDTIPNAGEIEYDGVDWKGVFTSSGGKDRDCSCHCSSSLVLKRKMFNNAKNAFKVGLN